MWVSSFKQFCVLGTTAGNYWCFDICESFRERRVVFCKFHVRELRRVKTLYSSLSDICFNFVFYSKRLQSVIFSRGKRFHSVI